jgi:hypothetical protein
MWNNNMNTLKQDNTEKKEGLSKRSFSQFSRLRFRKTKSAVWKVGDIQLEKMFLSILLNTPKNYVLVRDKIFPDFFINNTNALVFYTFEQLVKAGVEATSTVIGDSFKKEDELFFNHIGGYPFLSDLECLYLERNPLEAKNFEHYSQRIIDFTNARRLMEGKGIISNLISIKEENEDLLDIRREYIHDVENNILGIFPEKIESYLYKVSRALNLDYESLFCSFLGNYSAALGRSVEIEFNSKWIESGVVWIALAGKTGLGKSACLGHGGKYIIDEYQNYMIEQYQDELDVEQDKDVDISPPKRNLLYATYLTVEKLFQLHQENRLGISIINDELAAHLDGRNQYKNGGGNDQAKFLDIWNGRSISNPAGNELRAINKPFVSILGGIQNELLNKIISNDGLIDGFSSRFLFHIMQPNKGKHFLKTRERNEVLNSVTNEEQSHFHHLFREAVESRSDENLLVHTLRFNSESKELLYDFHDELENKAQIGDDLRYSPIMKLKTYSLRFALLLQKIWTNEEIVVEKSITERAILMTKFFLKQQEKAFNYVLGSEDEIKTRKILDKIQVLNGITKPEQLKACLHRSFGGKAKMGEFLNKLVKGGVLEEVREGREKYLIIKNSNEVTK